MKGQHERSTARASFEREHCTDLPDAYRRLLPETDDPAALADAEQSIRAQFRNDLKQARRASGDSLSSSADESGRGLPPAAAIDYARLTPLQQIAVGLKRAKAGRPTEVRTVPPAPVDEESDEPLFVGAD